MVINRTFENDKELNDFLASNQVRVINIFPKLVSTNNFLSTAISKGGTFGGTTETKEVLDVWYEDKRKYLFTTLDGKEIFEGMMCWYYNPDTPKGEVLDYRNCNGKAVIGKYFSTKEAAEKYIAENRPKTTRIVVHDKADVEYQINNKIIRLHINNNLQEINVIAYDINDGVVNTIAVLPSTRNEITLRF